MWKRKPVTIRCTSVAETGKANLVLK